MRRWLWIATPIAFAAAALLAASFAPFDALRAYVDAMDADGHARAFTPELHAAAARKARLSAVILLAVAGLVCAVRRRVDRAMDGPLHFLRRGARDDARQLATALGALFEPRRYLVAVLALTALGGALRLLFLHQPMRFDEAYSFIHFASRPLPAILADYHAPNNHVLHSIATAIAFHLAGDAPWALRLPALLTGILLVPVAYAATAPLYGRATGLVAAALVASSSLLVEYSTTSRGYMQVALFSILLIGLAAYVKGRRSAIAWASIAVFAALGLHTVPVMLYPVGLVATWLLLSGLFRDVSPAYGRTFLVYLTASLAAGALLTTLLYSPVLLVSGLRPFTSNEFVTSLGWPELAASLRMTGSMLFEQWTRDMPLPLVWLVCGACVAGLFARTRLPHRHVALPLASFLWIAALLVMLRVPGWPRVWLFLLPISLIWASAGIALIVRALLGSRARTHEAGALSALALAIALAGAFAVARNRSVLASPETGTLRDAEAIALFLRDQLAPGDVVVASGPSSYPLLYYFRRHGVSADAFFRERYWREFERAWVVVNDSHRQTLAQVLESRNLAGAVTLADSTPVRAFESGHVCLGHRAR